jgi:catechol 2,3-dioxygenase-like lactoylglutathione lyase family enzyme
MLDHLGLNVSDYAASKSFYAQALAPLGLECLMEPVEGICGFGSPEDRKPFFWITTRGPAHTGLHVAFAAPDRATVDVFHAAAVAAGATDNGQPGLREIYHPHYYGAFVHDLDGNNIEAVCHMPA